MYAPHTELECVPSCLPRRLVVRASAQGIACLRRAGSVRRSGGQRVSCAGRGRASPCTCVLTRARSYFPGVSGWNRCNRHGSQRDDGLLGLER